MAYNEIKRRFSIPASLTIVGLMTLGLLLAIPADNASGAPVTVTASIAESVSCTSATTTTAFGVLSTGSITTSAPTATTTLSCNSSGGCTLNVQDIGDSASPGLYKAAGTTSAELIDSADATLSAGTEGYGIQSATTTAGTGATLGLIAKYHVTGNQVGGLTLANVAIASTTAPTSGREVVVTHKAAISGLTRAGSYTDTITYSCTGN